MTTPRNPSDDFALFTGEMNALAYVKPMETERGKCFGVFSSDGTQLAVFNTQDAAFFAALQNDLEPKMLH